MLTIVSATNPKFTSSDGSGIDLMVQFKEFQDPIPFHATKDDPMEHGVELWQRASKGEFGTPQAYTPPANQPKTTGTKAA